MTLPIHTQWTTPQDVLSAFRELEDQFTAAPDGRGVFVTAYLVITTKLVDKVSAGSFFHDDQWVSQYLLDFANLYRRALLEYENGNLTQVPGAWRIAFDTARSQRGNVLQALALGIHAHIRRDLPFALIDAGVPNAEPQQTQRYQDHTRINQALAEAIGTVQDELARRYQPVLGWLDWFAGWFDEIFTSWSFQVMREAAWHDGIALRDGSKNPADLEREAEEQARRIRNASELELAFLLDSGRPAGSDSEPPEPLPENLSRAIDQLEDMVEELDARRDRLALLPALHAEMLHAVGHRIARKRFADEAWASQVAAATSVELLRAMRAFRNRDMQRVPRSWAVPMKLSHCDYVTNAQLIALTANAIARHDLAISLFRTDVRAETLETHRDTFTHVVEAMDDAVRKALLAARTRYSGYSIAVDGFAEALRDLVDRFSFKIAAAAGFDHAKAIAAAPGDAKREQFVALDGDTASCAMRIGVLPTKAPAPRRQEQKQQAAEAVDREWLIGALCERDRAWKHPWSEWLRGSPETTAWRDVLGARFARLPLPLRILLGERAERRVRGEAQGTADIAWPLAPIFERVGLPISRIAGAIRIEGSVDGPREHWVQIFGSGVLPTRQWNDGGLLAVAFDAWRFRFHLHGDADHLVLQQRDARFGLLPVPAFLAPQVEVEVKATHEGLEDEGLEVRVCVDAPGIGRVVDYRARVHPE
jgi:hypothetical protein